MALRLMCDTPAILRELNVVEQRCRAALEVLDGIPVTEVDGSIRLDTICVWLMRAAGLARRAPVDRNSRQGLWA